ncbi:hypothetical protein LTS16_002207 [Friedmanniomyces endolithicus]|uniref:Uncharacterized protein n=1 Tax=Friedmanniomyces endolithicus TaxID=329885 RepID=A0AAN6FJ88_9PEZI|nr:hypothetical protein LTR35_003238 [Friedmanniomyces endolithicus]KAK0293095.1 hypothetical protein LTS00_007696 [Friedmanniomyces endolithicus]KAK0319430.1 hypothetical protein LTR82_009495 [Friedmanniomyces endolithicus]KAK0930292.1 hypothetical protein LTR57_001462 [Friedmanniomyces endolithicus]KAK0993388.1 hypothetical protein LTR54_011160 [Friedmanniomyces endolithicus]
MLTAPLLRRRLLSTQCVSGSVGVTRRGSSNSSSNGRENRLGRGGRRGPDQATPKEASAKRDAQGTSSGRAGSSSKLSLIEQLFPEETKRYEEAQCKVSREIPRLPLDTFPVPKRSKPRPDRPTASQSSVERPATAQRIEDRMRRQDASLIETTVLVLRNASTNLVEEDFRRLIPQGRHMEGWTLEQGDILKVIPGRNLATLEQQNYYYLLFASKLSAFTYQGHATRIARMAASHTPSSMTSPIAVPPGYTIDGMDAHSAIQSFALVPASQDLDLRQLEPPLSPMMTSIVRNRGYNPLVSRSDRMAFEVRLTLDGPQIPANRIRYVLLETARDRSLAWSGGEELAPKITKWEPKYTVSPWDRESRTARAVSSANNRSEEEQMQWDLEKQKRKTERAGMAMEFGPNGQEQKQMRTPGAVYVLGFYTEMAAQQFVQHWHQRPMAGKGDDGEQGSEDELPPVANAEILWFLVRSLHRMGSMSLANAIVGKDDTP